MTISEAYYAHEWHLINQNVTDKTRENYRTAFFGRNGLLNTTGDMPIEEIGDSHMIAWKLHMRREGIQASSINTNIRKIRRLLMWLANEGHQVMDYKKILFDKEDTDKPHTTLEIEEIKQMVSYAKTPRDKAIIHLFFGTGCRSSEIIGLDREDWYRATLVDRDAMVWEIWVLGKNKKHRPVCFYQEVKSAIDKYLASRTDSFKPLFISQQNRRVHPDTVNKMLHKLSRHAGLEKRVTQHVFRHSYATEKGASGMPLPTLAYSLGHKSASTTQKVYTHINVRHSRSAYAEYGKKLLTN